MMRSSAYQTCTTIVSTYGTATSKYARILLREETEFPFRALNFGLLCNNAYDL